MEGGLRGHSERDSESDLAGDARGNLSCGLEGYLDCDSARYSRHSSESNPGRYPPRHLLRDSECNSQGDSEDDLQDDLSGDLRGYVPMHAHRLRRALCRAATVRPQRGSSQASSHFALLFRSGATFTPSARCPAGRIPRLLSRFCLCLVRESSAAAWHECHRLPSIRSRRSVERPRCHTTGACPFPSSAA